MASGIPQPSRRWRYLTICCSQRFWGRSSWTGRGGRAYRRHWREEHEQKPSYCKWRRETWAEK